MPKKQTQRTENPYEHTDTNKRYYTYDYYLRTTFGGKCAKIPIDVGFTCPNIDGKCGVGGCIYCSGRGSGDFAQLPTVRVEEQYYRTRERLSSKWNVERCIPYFQAHTNTYAPLDVVRQKIQPVLGLEGVVALNIATRADCLGEDICLYMNELSERLPLTLELGLQTVHDTTARMINRGHTYADFVEGYERLRRLAPKAGVCIHVIFGLPSETEQMMLDTIDEVARLHPEQIKIHLLHVLRGTRLAEMYASGEYTPMTQEAYVRTVVNAIERLPSDIVVARLTGDGMQSELLAPDWSRKKVAVINQIDKLLYARGTYQGIYCDKS